MNDISCTIAEVKTQVIDMCRRKNWGEDGIQDPQHVTMAMLVEAMELLEHFAEPQIGDITDIAEELSDVLMYAMQLMYTLRIDVSREVSAGFSDAVTPIAQLKRYAGIPACTLMQQAMQVGIKARFVLEVFQWLTESQVKALIKGELPDTARAAGEAFGPMFLEVMRLANMLDIDISNSIARKIAIVDKRVYPADDPVR